MSEIQKIHHSNEMYKKNEGFKEIVNKNVPKEWVKIHPYASDVKYIPIEKIEYLLDKIFQEWKVEVKEAAQLFNSVSVTIRLHYKMPTNGEWLYMDGVGAVGIQTDKGKTASDLGSIKNNAVMLALPAAKSYAIKDAAENIGDIFGRNLNRKDAIAFKRSYQEDITEGQISLIESLTETSLYSHEERDMLLNGLDNLTKDEANEMIETLKNNQLDPSTHGGNPSVTDANRKVNQILKDDKK